MKAAKGLSRRGFLGASTGLTAGAGLGLHPGLVLAQADGGPEADSAPGLGEGSPPSVQAAEAAVERRAEAILRISREVWQAAELSLAEAESARIHLRELEAAGFRTVSTGTSGYPTAFVSEWSQGSGGPVIAYLPEYDALPDLGNATEPRRAPARAMPENG